MTGESAPRAANVVSSRCRRRLDKQLLTLIIDVGADWYRKTWHEMEDVTTKIFPETKDPGKNDDVQGDPVGLSGGQTPEDNFTVASEAFAT